MNKGVKLGLFVLWCRSKPQKRTKAAFCSLLFFKTPPPKLRQRSAHLQRRKMIFDNVVFKKRTARAARRGGVSREVQGGLGVTCLEGRALTHSHKSKDEGAGRRAELRRAAGLLHHQPAVGSSLVCGCCKGRGTYSINVWPQCRSETDKSQQCWHFWLNSHFPPPHSSAPSRGV